ncbi:MAG: transporter [Caulobacter sp.]|nr:transporter [Caulobacter sp.]
MSSAFITLDNLAARTPDGRPLFENLSLAFGRERTGLVGRNGVGKTTLLRLLAGEAEPAAGTVARKGTVGVLRQTLAPAPGVSVADLLGVSERLALLDRVTAGEGSDADFDAADWTLPTAIEDALLEVGLEGLDPMRPADTLSGGQLTRAALAALLIARPDLILLDEPTNNLDADARAMVAGFLSRWKGGAVVVSHDRTLLRAMDRIVELSSPNTAFGGAKVYGGNWDLYVERRDAERAAAERDLETAARDARRVERDVQAARERQTRRDAAGRKFAAKGSEPKILLGAMAERAENTGARGNRLAERQREAAGEALAAAQSRLERARSLGFDLPSSGLPAGKTVLVMEDVTYAWPGGLPVLQGFSLRITGPERVAVVGPNGAGKSTLLALAAGLLAPSRGRISRPGASVLLDQRTAVLREGETILQAFRRLNPDATANDAHAALARFLFRNTAAHQVVATLSGGERLRAALACVLSGREPPQLLILDEPTNHLDLQAIEAVEAALSGYDGALLTVSHDPDFLEAIGTTREIRLG